MIDLFTAATPNGWKVSIAFEEMELPYNPIVLNLSERKQHEEWFYQMNPNGRIPVIVDHDVEDLTIFETGAIMLYLAEKSGKFMPSDFKRRHAAMQWLMFQMSGIGPKRFRAEFSGQHDGSFDDGAGVRTFNGRSGRRCHCYYG